jgi:hypothetical protein
MRSAVFAIVFFMAPCFQLKALAMVNDSLTLDDLENQYGVHYTLTALGGYQQYCLSLSLSNTTNDSIGIYIEPGRVLVCDSSYMQDLIVMRALYFKVSPREESRNSLFAFCCRAKKMPPSKNTRFENGYLDRDGLGMLAAFVSQGNYLSKDIQSSVWAISDNRPIASICDGGTSPLKKWLVKMLNKPNPWHCIEYDRADTSVLQSRHLRVTGVFSFKVSHYATLIIQVRTKEGHIVDYIQRNALYTAGDFDYPLDLDVKGWPKGVYEILVFEDGNRINQPTFFDL